jgi:hypothetical protein|tara:strand:+ start:1328 stop:1717 length:390 start_codon:yes stop_codon:yes gene_type:complete
MELNNKQTLRTLREQIENALKDRVVLEELVFELGSCSYDRDGSNATFKLNVRVKGAKTREEKQLNSFADLDEIDINKTWTEGTREFKLCGYNTKAPKFPYLMKDINSSGTQTYKIGTSTAKRWFAKECA